LIWLVKEGDMIDIDIRGRTISLRVAEAEIAERRAAQDKLGWKPARSRPRKILQTLRAYALFATSASTGAVREFPGE
jgi:dihydroxy-acid dehydratase